MSRYGNPIRLVLAALVLLLAGPSWLGAQSIITIRTIPAGVAAGVAGSDTQVQFNDGGVFGADAGLTFNKTTNILYSGSLELTTSANEDSVVTIVPDDNSYSWTMQNTTFLAGRAWGWAVTDTGNMSLSSDATSGAFAIAQNGNITTAGSLTLTGVISSDGTTFVGEPRSGFSSFHNVNNGSTNIGRTNAGVTFGAVSNGNSHAFLNNSTFGMRSGMVAGWSASAGDPNAAGTVDTGFARNAAGVVEVNNGSAGTIATITAKYRSGGTTPAVANAGANSCGTTAATIAGNDNAGIVTVGATSGTQCRITFTIAAPARWQCSASNETTANLARGIYVDTTHADLKGTFVAGDVVSYQCTPR